MHRYGPACGLDGCDRVNRRSSVRSWFHAAWCPHIVVVPLKAKQIYIRKSWRISRSSVSFVQWPPRSKLLLQRDKKENNNKYTKANQRKPLSGLKDQSCVLSMVEYVVACTKVVKPA